MWRVLRRLSEFVRAVGSGIDAGHAIRLGLPVPERVRRHSSDLPELPWTEAGPAQPGRVYPSPDGWWRQR